MLIIGLTGGIGSGKSEVSRRFEALGIAVADADIAARTVVTAGQPALEKIIQHFGPDIVNQYGDLERAKLRAIIFQHPDEKHWLESLLHPLIATELERLLKQANKQANSQYCILTSPLLLETEQWQKVDRILVIDVTEATQIQRSCNRDNTTEAQIRAIIAAQMPRSERLARADDVIDNNGALDALQAQIETLDRLYRG